MVVPLAQEAVHGARAYHIGKLPADVNGRVSRTHDHDRLSREGFWHSVVVTVHDTPWKLDNVHLWRICEIYT